MKFRNKEELKAWLDGVAQEHARLNAERMLADGCDPNEVNEFVAQWTADAERQNQAIAAEIERVVSEPDAPSHALN